MQASNWTLKQLFVTFRSPISPFVQNASVNGCISLSFNGCINVTFSFKILSTLEIDMQQDAPQEPLRCSEKCLFIKLFGEVSASKPVILVLRNQYYLRSLLDFYVNYFLKNIYLPEHPSVGISGCLWIFWTNVSTHRENLTCFLYFPSYFSFNNTSLNLLGFSQVLPLYRKNVATRKHCL